MHDELVFEVPAGRGAEFKQWVKNEMEAVYKLDVPLVVDVGAGPPGATRTDRNTRDGPVKRLRLGYHRGLSMRSGAATRSPGRRLSGRGGGRWLPSHGGGCGGAARRRRVRARAAAAGGRRCRAARCSATADAETSRAAAAAAAPLLPRSAGLGGRAGRRSLLDRAAELFDDGDYTGALACAEEAARQAPRSVEAHHNRAIALMRLDRLDEARDAIALALALAPDDPETLEAAADLQHQSAPAVGAIGRRWASSTRGGAAATSAAAIASGSRAWRCWRGRR